MNTYADDYVRVVSYENYRYVFALFHASHYVFIPLEMLQLQV